MGLQREALGRRVSCNIVIVIVIVILLLLLLGDGCCLGNQNKPLPQATDPLGTAVLREVVSYQVWSIREKSSTGDARKGLPRRC